MSTLYELTDEYLQLDAMMSDPDIDPQTIADTMEGIEGEIEIKAEGYAKIIQIHKAKIAAIEKEIERLQAMKNLEASNIKRMQSALQYSMELTGKLKFKTPLFSFGIQKNPPSVVIDDQTLLPEEYLIQQEPKIDKKALLADIKNGRMLEGIAHIEQGQSIRIR